MIYPSPFSVGDRFDFSNRHGSVILEAVTLPQPVSEIYFKDAPDECRMTWDEMEQIVLITDQVRLQPVAKMQLGPQNAAFVRHATCSTAGWVKIVELKYLSKIPAKDQIQADLDGGRNRILLA